MPHVFPRHVPFPDLVDTAQKLGAWRPNPPPCHENLRDSMRGRLMAGFSHLSPLDRLAIAIHALDPALIGRVRTPSASRQNLAPTDQRLKTAMAALAARTTPIPDAPAFLNAAVVEGANPYGPFQLRVMEPHPRTPPAGTSNRTTGPMT